MKTPLCYIIRNSFLFVSYIIIFYDDFISIDRAEGSGCQEGAEVGIG
jgi:hypothetical protein